MDTASNIDAATGFGKFDLQLARNAGVLNVIIRVRIVDPGNQLIFAGGKGPYLSDWQKNINQLWSNKIVLRHPGLQKDVKVRFVLNDVAGGEHFAVQIIGGYDGGSGVKFVTPAQGRLADPAGVGANGIWLALGQNSNKTFAAHQASQNATGQLGNTRTAALGGGINDVVAAAGNDHFDVTLDRNGASWTIPAASQQMLDDLCVAINTPRGSAAPLIYVHSASGLQGKADALAHAVVQYMRGRGVANQIDVNPQKLRRKFSLPGSSHKTSATVRVEIESLQSAFDRRYGIYTVAAHEFGHLFGIPDEYLDYSGFSNATIRNSQPNWDKLCTKWGLRRRAWTGQFNDSMMSIGTRVYPAHAATILEALSIMTDTGGSTLLAGGWSLVEPR
jgi:hypothetical protein